MAPWLSRSATALVALVLTGAAPVDLPLDSLLKSPEAARTFDYWRLREGRDPQAIKALGSTITADDDRVCRSDAEREIKLGLQTAAEAPSRSQWQADRTAGAEAVRLYDAARDKALAGQPSGAKGLDENLPVYLAQSRAAKTSLGRELLRRMAAEQAPMVSWSAPWTEGLADGAQLRLFAVLEHEQCVNAHANAEWLKGEIAKQGWPTISRDGAEADKAAWILVQHADHDPQFQKDVLERLTALRTKGETNPSNYAYLHDRVAANAGREQRYGTQGGCKAGQWTVKPLEDPANVDRRRADVGLKPLADYVALFRCRA